MTNCSVENFFDGQFCVWIDKKQPDQAEMLWQIINRYARDCNISLIPAWTEIPIEEYLQYECSGPYHFCKNIREGTLITGSSVPLTTTVTMDTFSKYNKYVESLDDESFMNVLFGD